MSDNRYIKNAHKAENLKCAKVVLVR